MLMAMQLQLQWQLQPNCFRELASKFDYECCFNVKGEANVNSNLLAI
jgi:hypothetical protein